MKVSEAKEKVCPFMSIGFAADTPSLRMGGLVEITCICGDCMAWKWDMVEGEFMGDDLFKPSKEEGYCARIGQ